MGMRRFTRLTNAFCKKLANHDVSELPPGCGGHRVGAVEGLSPGALFTLRTVPRTQMSCSRRVRFDDVRAAQLWHA